MSNNKNRQHSRVVKLEEEVKGKGEEAGEDTSKMRMRPAANEGKSWGQKEKVERIEDEDRSPNAPLSAATENRL